MAPAEFSDKPISEQVHILELMHQMMSIRDELKSRWTPLPNRSSSDDLAEILVEFQSFYPIVGYVGTEEKRKAVLEKKIYELKVLDAKRKEEVNNLEKEFSEMTRLLDGAKTTLKRKGSEISREDIDIGAFDTQAGKVVELCKKLRTK